MILAILLAAELPAGFQAADLPAGFERAPREVEAPAAAVRAPPAAVRAPLAVAGAPRAAPAFHGSMLLVDGLALGALALGSVTDSPGAAAAGVTGYLLVPPILHAAHQSGHGLGSFLLRLLAPIGGAMAGSGLGGGSSGAVGGAVLGMLSASLLDIIFLSGGEGDAR